jgi:hypothetical protein
VALGVTVGVLVGEGITVAVTVAVGVTVIVGVIVIVAVIVTVAVIVPVTVAGRAGSAVICAPAGKVLVAAGVAVSVSSGLVCWRVTS